MPQAGASDNETDSGVFQQKANRVWVNQQLLTKPVVVVVVVLFVGSDGFSLLTIAPSKHLDGESMAVI